MAHLRTNDEINALHLEYVKLSDAELRARAGVQERPQRHRPRRRGRPRRRRVALCLLGRTAGGVQADRARPPPLPPTATARAAPARAVFAPRTPRAADRAAEAAEARAAAELN